MTPPAPPGRPGRHGDPQTTGEPAPVRSGQSRRAGVIGLVAAAAVVLVVLLAGGPGGAGGPQEAAGPSEPPQVPIEQFCGRFDALGQSALDLQPGGTTAPEVRADAAEVRELAAGTTMPEDVRSGLDYIFDLLAGLEDAATVDDLAAEDQQSTIDEVADADALNAWLNTTCP